MEIKARLKKPYTEQQRCDFIIQQNHTLGRVINETETELQALGYSASEKTAQRRAEFEKGFFETSLGWIRRSVTMADGSRKDFLSDLLPTISMGVTSGVEVKIIAYNKPPFSRDIEDWTEYQHIEVVTPQFIQECFMQLSNDFLPINEDEV